MINYYPVAIVIVNDNKQSSNLGQCPTDFFVIGDFRVAFRLCFKASESFIQQPSSSRTTKIKTSVLDPVLYHKMVKEL